MNTYPQHTPLGGARAMVADKDAWAQHWTDEGLPAPVDIPALAALRALIAYAERAEARAEAAEATLAAVRDALLDDYRFEDYREMARAALEAALGEGSTT